MIWGFLSDTFSCFKGEFLRAIRAENTMESVFLFFWRIVWMRLSMIFQRWVLVGSSAYWFRVEPYSKYHTKISINACRNIMRHKLCPIIPKGRNFQIIYSKNEAIRMENNSMEITQVHTFSWKWISPIKSWITGQNLHYISQFISGPAFSNLLDSANPLKDMSQMICSEVVFPVLVDGQIYHYASKF